LHDAARKISMLDKELPTFVCCDLLVAPLAQIFLNFHLMMKKMIITIIII